MPNDCFRLVSFLIILLCAVLAAAVLKALIRGLARLVRRQRARRMPLNTMSPEDFEERVAWYFRTKGYSRVTLTPKSGDYGADVLATAPTGERVCVQCKLYRGTVGVKAVQEIYAAMGYYGCEKAYVFATNDFTIPAQNMADANGVTLVNVCALPEFTAVGGGRTFILLAVAALLIAGLLFVGRPWEKLQPVSPRAAVETVENAVDRLRDRLLPGGDEAEHRDYVIAG